MADFIDSNIFVYTDDQDAPAKREAALELFTAHRRNRTGVVSLQVLQEYFVTVTRKLSVDPTLARRKTELISQLTLVIPQREDVLAAIDLHRLHNLSFWDAMIVRAALSSGCSRLLSEDMQHGRRIESLESVNPFL